MKMLKKGVVFAIIILDAGGSNDDQGKLWDRDRMDFWHFYHSSIRRSSLGAASKMGWSATGMVIRKPNRSANILPNV